MPDTLRVDGTPTAMSANRTALAVVVKHRIHLYSTLDFHSLGVLEGTPPLETQEEEKQTKRK